MGTISQIVTDFDTVKLNGWYWGAAGTAHAPDSEHDWSVCVTNLVHNSEVCIQDAYAITNVNKYLHCRRLVYIDTATQNNPWEWVNPPMELGVEYRTTERYLGEPVYVKVVNCGVLPSGATLTVKHEIANVGMIAEAKAIASNSTAGYNGRAPFPQVYNNSLTNGWTNYLVAATSKEILIYCGGGLAGCSVYVTMRYTKDTQ